MSEYEIKDIELTAAVCFRLNDCFSLGEANTDF
jgi:hypothetical protein